MLFGHFCQKFSIRVLLRFCLIFCQFHPNVAHKSVAYKNSVYILHIQSPPVCDLTQTGGSKLCHLIQLCMKHCFILTTGTWLPLRKSFRRKYDNFRPKLPASFKNWNVDW